MRFVHIVSPCIFLGIVSSLAVDSQWNTYDRASPPTLTPNSSWFAGPQNISSLLGVRAKVRCDSLDFGQDLNIKSCNLALANVPFDRHLTEFTARESAQNGIILPYRYLSRK